MHLNPFFPINNKAGGRAQYVSTLITLEVSRQIHSDSMRQTHHPSFQPLSVPHPLHQQLSSSNVPEWDVLSAQRHLITHFNLNKASFLITVSFLSLLQAGSSLLQGHCNVLYTVIRRRTCVGIRSGCEKSQDVCHSPSRKVCFVRSPASLLQVLELTARYPSHPA